MEQAAMNHEPEQRYLINRTYDEIQVGDSASLTRILMPETSSCSPS
jgi:phosphate acetyltransferase